MRHFEEYEMEHVRNGTGAWWRRICCAWHIRNCPVCRDRYAALLRENAFLGEVRRKLSMLEPEDGEKGSDADARDEGRIKLFRGK